MVGSCLVEAYKLVFKLYFEKQVLHKNYLYIDIKLKRTGGNFLLPTFCHVYKVYDLRCTIRGCCRKYISRDFNSQKQYFCKKKINKGSHIQQSSLSLDLYGICLSPFLLKTVFQTSNMQSAMPIVAWCFHYFAYQYTFFLLTSETDR